MTLAERIATVLAGTGYRPYSEAAPEPTHHSGPFFQVTEGVGATVSVAWTDATDAERSLMLARYATRLHEVGLNAERRDGYLYVSEETITEFPTIEAFYDERSERRGVEADYGYHWQADGVTWPHWRVSYIQATGEVFAVRQYGNPIGPVRILGIVPPDAFEGRGRGGWKAPLDRILAGWADTPNARDLAWIEERLAWVQPVARITSLLADAGHVQCVFKTRGRNAPPPAAGFRILPSSDGSIYVTWATGESRPHETNNSERNEAFTRVGEYADLLTAAGYQVKVEGTLWCTARILPPETTEG